MKSNAALKLAHPTAEIQADPAIEISGLDVWFSEMHVLRDINIRVLENKINCIVGPSGSGKSTLIRCINRMNDETAGFSLSGSVKVGGRNILHKNENVARLRTAVGMVFQKPCVFPKSIAENVLFGVQHLRKLSTQERMQLVETNLKAAALWQEVRHRLHDPASSLSIGQQQRLCIARSLAVGPEVILLDEPTSSLDPVSTRAIEDLMVSLKRDYTIVFVTHNIQQAHRIADQLIFMCNGEIIEQGPKEKLFRNPEREATRQYLGEEYCDC